ncbi:MAG TPA: DUF4105 domain-containing protein [Candidatus Krumholzibacteria bacterium]|nr:DUF4105 domain-containing protein [Candidatus Krumholzibacteria bacterium]
MLVLLALFFLWPIAPSSAVGQLHNGSSGGAFYIGYAGPYAASPASAFGHLFLLHQPTDDTPLALWRAMTFRADVTHMNSARSFLQGVSGGLSGSFAVTEFHELTLDYELIEDRDLWLFRLRLDRAEYSAMKHHFRESDGSRHRYSFFTSNCASQLLELIRGSLTELRSGGAFVSPLDVVQRLAEKERIESAYVRSAATRILRFQVRELPSRIRNHVANREWTELASDTEWIESVQPDHLWFLSRYFRYRQIDHRHPLGEEVAAGLGGLRIRLAENETPTLPSAPHLSPGAPTSFPTWHPRTEVSPYLRFHDNRSHRLGIRLRPALHEEHESWVGHRPFNSMVLLTTEIETAADELDPTLSEFTVFSQRSLVPQDWLVDKASWSFDARLARGGPYGARELHAEVGVGIGLTRRWHGVAVSILPTATVWNGLDDLTSLHGGVQFHVNRRTDHFMVYGFSGSYGHAMIGPGGGFGGGRAWVGARLHPRVAILGALAQRQDDTSTTLSVRLYP